MRRQGFDSASAHWAFSAVRRGSSIESIPTVRQRLNRAEQELRVQFTRIAQLQAQLDVVLGALRGSPDEVRLR
jgi:hypothetical protein